MMKTYSCKALTAAIVFLTIGILNAQDSLIIEKIKANTHELTIENGRLAGKGATVIKDAIGDSQFLLVGEQHGIREVSEFTSALFIEAAPLGYEYLCIETDPYMANKLEELATEGEGALQEFSEAYPISFPFYSGKEEFQLLQTALTHTSGTEKVIWGVDQVFMAAPRYLFSILLQEAHTDEAKTVVSSYLERSKASYDQFMETSDPGKLILLSLNGTDFKKMDDAFGPDISDKARSILSDIRTTKEIYSLWATGKYYENNHTRVQLMKKQFMGYYNQALTEEKLPKVVLKFGSTHTYRGLSYYHQFDLGNMVSELAEMNGKQSVHFHCSGIKGLTQGFAGPPQPFDNSSMMNPLVKKVLDETEDNESWVLIDMRPLRHTLNQAELDKIKDVVFGYDFWIYVREANPVSSF